MATELVAQPESAVQVSRLVDTVDRPRLMREEDLEWLHYLCLKRYDQRYSPESTELWFRDTVLKSPMMFLPVRTDDAFLIALIAVLPWLPNEFECNMIFGCADTDCMWQLVKLLRVSIEWARRRKCTIWRVSSDTEYDFRPLAKRFGAAEASPRWLIRLRDPDA